MKMINLVAGPIPKIPPLEPFAMSNVRAASLNSIISAYQKFCDFLISHLVSYLKNIMFRPYSHETQYCDKKIKRYCDKKIFLSH